MKITGTGTRFFCNRQVSVPDVPLGAAAAPTPAPFRTSNQGDPAGGHDILHWGCPGHIPIIVRGTVRTTMVVCRMTTKEAVVWFLDTLSRRRLYSGTAAGTTNALEKRRIWELPAPFVRFIGWGGVAPRIPRLRTPSPRPNRTAPALLIFS